MIKDKIINNILTQLAEENNCKESEVEKVLETTYKFMRKQITDLKVKESGQEKMKLSKTNFMMPGLFKLYIDYPKWTKIMESMKYHEELNNNNKIEENE